MSCAEKPGAPRSTRKPRIVSPSFAQTTARSAIEPFVIHRFVPDRTQPEPSRRARVSMPPGSEPWSGSVSPKQPITRPAAIPGRQRLPLDEAPDARLRDALLLGEELVDAVVVDLAWCHATLPRLAHMQGPSRHYWLATGRGRPYESI